MGSNSESSDHSTVWTGRQWLADSKADGVPFSAWLTISDGRISGSLLEPNAFVLADCEELEADIRGHVDDTEIVFLKTYRTFVHEPVYFEGELDHTGCKIVGRWYFGWPDEVTGTFEMTRKTQEASAQQQQGRPAVSTD